MAATLRGQEITDYSGPNGNTIVGAPSVSPDASVEFQGSNCTVTFDPGATLHGSITFRGDDSYVILGDGSLFRGSMALGLGCEIGIGDGFLCGAGAYLTAAEGANIRLGHDVLVSDRFQARADGSSLEQRPETSKSITVGDHVWIGADATLAAGAVVGSGSVLRMHSVVTQSMPVPESCLASGSPAVVRRRQVSWVRDDVDDSTDPDVIDDDSRARCELSGDYMDECARHHQEACAGSSFYRL